MPDSLLTRSYITVLVAVSVGSILCWAILANSQYYTCSTTEDNLVSTSIALDAVRVVLAALSVVIVQTKPDPNKRIVSTICCMLSCAVLLGMFTAWSEACDKCLLRTTTKDQFDASLAEMFGAPKWLLSGMSTVASAAQLLPDLLTAAQSANVKGALALAVQMGGALAGADAWMVQSLSLLIEGDVSSALTKLTPQLDNAAHLFAPIVAGSDLSPLQSVVAQIQPQVYTDLMGRLVAADSVGVSCHHASSGLSGFGVFMVKAQDSWR